MSRSVFIRLAIILATAPFALEAAASTTLTFESVSPAQASYATPAPAGNATNKQIPEDFGSRITAASADMGKGFAVNGDDTANITLSWTPRNANFGGQVVRWEFYRDNVWSKGVAQMNNAVVGKTYSVAFTPDAGYGVILRDFGLSSYYEDAQTSRSPVSGQFEFDWSVTRVADGKTVASGTTGLFTRKNNPVVNIDYVAKDSGAYRLDLTRVDTIAGASFGDSSAIGLEKLTFAQRKIPEPASYGLLGAGALLGVAAIRRRRR